MGEGLARMPAPPVNTPVRDAGTPTPLTRAGRSPVRGMGPARKTSDDSLMNLDTAIEALRDARRALLFHDYEQRVAAYYAVEDVAAELSALLLSTDPRAL